MAPLFSYLQPFPIPLSDHRCIAMVIPAPLSRVIGDIDQRDRLDVVVLPELIVDEPTDLLRRCGSKGIVRSRGREEEEKREGQLSSRPISKVAA